MADNRHRPPVPAVLLNSLKNIFGRNIATVIFTVLFLYLVIGAIYYLTSSHIESYQVVSGPLSRNETYTGLAIREEKIVKADSNGYINYYAREGNKINAGGAVYGLSATQNPETETRLSQEDLYRVRDQMMSYSKGFNPSKFNSVYSFKYQLEGSILQYSGVTGQKVETPDALTLENLMDMEKQGEDIVVTGANDPVTFGNQTISKSDADGIILYSKDGYEGKTLEKLTSEDFDQNSYHETDLKTNQRVKIGDDIYTIITDERWSLLIPLSERQAVKLAGRSSVRVKFLKDDMSQSGDFSIVEIDGSKYGKIDFNKGLVRYSSERFLEIELVTNTITGLKIPLSSIVTKDFYTIPSAFAIKDPNSEELTFQIATRTKDGKTETRVVSPTIYASIENPKKATLGSEETAEETTYTYYVDVNAFNEGDVLITKNGQSKYIIGEKSPLEGVYCINKGYAVFRRIQVQDQNEEYAIISKNTTYGVIRYDHIVKNAEKVKEEDILY